MATGKALAKNAALEVRAQLLLDAPGQSVLVVLARVGYERLKVLPHQAVKNHLGRSPRGVARLYAGHPVHEAREEAGARTNAALGDRRLDPPSVTVRFNSNVPLASVFIAPSSRSRRSLQWCRARHRPRSFRGASRPETAGRP